MSNDLTQKNSGESTLSYYKRLRGLVDSGIVDMTRSDIYELIFDEKVTDDYARRMFRTLSIILEKDEDLIGNYSANGMDKLAELKESVIEQKIRELQKERIKLQTDKIEYTKWIREDTREEMFADRIVEAIKSTNTDCSEIKPIYPTYEIIEHALFFADAHFAKEFKIYGLNNEILNEYSPEIFYERMEKIMGETLEYVSKNKVSILRVFNLGDSLDGFLRHSQIWTLRYGVIDSAIIYGKYMAEWFKKLSKFVKVEYHPTTGNHGECRTLDGKKGEHLNEDSEKIINELISIRNSENPNFELFTNKTGLIYTRIADFDLFGVHGEVKNPSQALKDFADVYGTNIDILATGHKHHGSFTNCGYRKCTIGVGSIVGSDDFSMKIKKQADATANIIAFENGKGKINEKTIILN